MVFESLVVELVNRFAGDYVENLDASQLKLGLWSGSAELNSLDLKESALDDLDLPIKIKAGHVGKVTLKIPWKNLYTEPVEVNIDGIYALAVPNIGIKYNAEKEEKTKQEAKQKQLQRIEDAKKIEAEKDKPKAEKQDSFVEKMATQIIKNLQIKVTNIHVRFEDQYTDPKRPFAVGVTLGELLFQTTDENWKPCILKEAVTQIFKIIRLDSLSLYWDSKAALYDSKPREELQKLLKDGVANPDHTPNNQYLIQPISSIAHLRLNTKPEESNFSIPKILLTIVFDEIGIALSKLQYDDVLEMAEAMERMTLLALYKKYRPSVKLLGNASAWWHYAYNSVLEETVRRRRRMWSWEHIRNHRQMMRRYREAYVKKLDSKKVSGDVQKVLDECEKQLDMFSLTVMRQQADVEAARLGAKRKEEGGGGWLGGWFGGGKKKAAKGKSEIQEKFYEQFSSDEKDKLYAAIGYQENEADLTLPKEFVAVRLVTKLNNVSLTIKQANTQTPPILKLQLKDLYSSVSQRPAANAISVDAKIDKLTVSGTPQGDFIPRLVKSQVHASKADEAVSLLDAQFETNPLDGLCDTRVKLGARPLEIIYDAITVNNIAEFFKPPESVQLKQFSQAAMAKFEEVKEQSAAGLQHAIEQHKYTDISVDLKPSYIIVPHSGKYTKDKGSMLLLDLGNLTLSSEKSQAEPGMAKNYSLDELRAKSYDKLSIQLQSIQALYVGPGEPWQQARQLGHSTMHILQPISIMLDIRKCILDDPRMAKMKMAGELPQLSVSMSDQRVQEILTLVNSIPFPESPPESDEPDLFAGPSTLPSAEVETVSSVALKSASGAAGEKDTTAELQRQTSSEFTNKTDLELTFVIKELSLTVGKRVSGSDVPFVKIIVEGIGTELKMRTFDMLAEAFVGAIYLQHLGMTASESLASQITRVTGCQTGSLINLVNTPAHAKESRLLSVSYMKANVDGPEFATTYKKTEQSVQVHFTSLELLVHQGAILSLMEFGQTLQEALAPAPSVAASTAVEKKDVAAVTSASPQQETDKPKAKKRRKKEKDPEIIDMKLDVALDNFGMALCTDDKVVTHIAIQGINTTIALQESKTAITAILRDMVISDPSLSSLYPKILAAQDSEVLKAEVIAYNNGTEGEKYGDMKCVDTSVKCTMGCIRLVFLNKFVTSVVAYTDPFQAAKDRVSEAGEAVAEYSKDVAASMQEKASRILLDVQIKAPVIIVPQCSTLPNILVADLGVLSLSNKFELPGAKTESGVPAVVEDMTVQLTDLKLSRGVVSDEGRVTAEVLILQPINIDVRLKRNLSAAWYHEAPDLNVVAAIGAVSVCLSHGDFAMMMKLMNDNLTEDQAPAVSQAPAQLAIEAPVGKTDAAASQTAAAPGAASSTPQGTSPQVAAFVKIKFAFTLESVSTSLFLGDSDLSGGVKRHAGDRTLGRIALELLKVNGHIMSDNAIETKVSLKDITLEDQRPEKSMGITRMVHRSDEDSKAVDVQQNMFNVSFVQNAALDKTIDASISSIYACICMEFLMTVSDFFVKALPKAPPAPPTPPPPAALAADIKAKSVAAEVVPAPTSLMFVTFHLAQPDIIMIEDQMNVSTNAIILQMEVDFKLKQTPDVQNISGVVKGFQLFSCVYDKRKATKSQILPPVDLTLLSNAPQGSGMHMDVQMTDLALTISPATIRILTAISGGFVTHTAVEEDAGKVVLPPSDLWAEKALTDCDFWYLKTADGDVTPPPPVEEIVNGIDKPVEEGRGEQLMVNLPAIILIIEGGVGKRTVPLIILEAAFTAEVRDWSSRLSVGSSLDMELAYYNEGLAVWEPILEPICEPNVNPRRWELQMEVISNNDPLPPPAIDDTDMDIVGVDMLLPKMVICIKSEDTLNLMVSKTCLDVLDKLGKAFTDAYNLVEAPVKTEEVVSPYLFCNLTGMDVTIKLDNEFQTTDPSDDHVEQMPEEASSGRIHLPPAKEMPVFERRAAAISASSNQAVSRIRTTQEVDNKNIIFMIEQFAATRQVMISRAERRLFEVTPPQSYPGTKCGIMIDIQSSYGQKRISLRSVVQVQNHFSVPIEVLYKGDNSEAVACGVTEPGQIFSVPLTCLYAASKELLFRPTHESKYQVSSESLEWEKCAQMMKMKQFTCKSQEGEVAFCLNVQCEIETCYFEDTDTESAQSYILHLHPTVILHNLLPLSIKGLLEGTEVDISLEQGENVPLHSAQVTQSTIEIRIQYHGREWSGRREIQDDIPELSLWSFESYDGSNKITLDLGLHCRQSSGSLDMSLYCPYWMLNKTGLKLAYKGGEGESITEHPADVDSVVLFSFRGKSFFSSKKDLEKDNKKSPDKKSPEKKAKVKTMRQSGKACIQIADTEWSNKFSLDTVGSSGTVQCKTKNGQEYEAGIKIQLSSTGLTKIVTFTSFFMISNTAEYPLMCAETKETPTWIEIPAGQCVPFWPTQTGKEVSLKAKVKDSDEETGAFLINQAHTTLLRLRNKYGGLNVECNVTESAMVTTLTSYKPGMATVLLVNETEICPLLYCQSGQTNKQVLSGKRVMLYTWEDALGKRQLVWLCGESKEQKTEVSQDGIGEFFYDSDTKVYWVSFLDGQQRVLLLTQDLVLATLAQQAGELEQIEQELVLSIRGMGLSLVNDAKQSEVLFMGITSSGIIWEEKRKRYKALNVKQCKALENGFMKFENEVKLGKTPPDKYSLEQKIEADFKSMLMLKPTKRAIRRSFQEGLWVQYRTSPHQTQLHAKIQRLQIDCQLGGVTFPTVLGPMPLPKSVAADSVPKPFTEVSLMLRKHEHSDMMQVKYSKVLIQEMALKVDQEFLNAIMLLFSADAPPSREQETESFQDDIKTTEKSIHDLAGVSKAQGQKNFYDYLHFSPIKVHLSFSLQAGGSGDSTAIKASVLNVFLQSVGVVLTDVQDVVFKLGYFEREHNFYTQLQLMSEMTRHYTNQAIKQMYVLVLGLDVLGNPFGLLRGLSEGIGDLFYEPYQGAVQGPEEFAEGLALGVRSLFGHALGGAAGAVGRITGTLGKGIAALTLDDDYQRKRREALNKRPASAREGFARGGKGLVMGVFDGVTGIVRKPIEGAKQEGAVGFAKGMGKGLIGVVTRPTSGVIDFASSSFEGIKRIAEMSDEIRRLRPPRRFHKDRIIRPYVHIEAEGYAVLQETEKGKFLDDDYVAHVVVTKDGKNVLVVTDKRMIYASRGELFGHWDCAWTHIWHELKEAPKTTNKGMEIILKKARRKSPGCFPISPRSPVEKEKKKFLFSSSSNKKEIHIVDKKLAEWIVEKIKDAMENDH